MARTPSALVLTGFGINCDYETETAFKIAGARAQRVHVNDIIADPHMLERFQILAVPGGFSFGDDVASGKILANRIRFKLGDAVQQFVDAGKLIIGICNGFQVLVKLGVLPGGNGGFRQDVTLTHNDSNRFEDRWVSLRKSKYTPCIWLEGIDTLEVPVRHGEGKYIPRDTQLHTQLVEHGQIALRYAHADGRMAHSEFPFNPNGSYDDVAGLCDPTGRIFGLMPHPEAHVQPTNHPRWTKEGLAKEGAGLAVFRNAVEFARTNL